MRNRVRITSVLFAAVAVAACGKSSDKSTTPEPAQTVTRTTTVEELTRSPAAAPATPTTPTTPTTGESRSVASAGCPIDMVGTTVVYEPSVDGGALIFRTDADFDAMRERTVAMAMDHSRRESALRLADDDLDDLDDLDDDTDLDDLDDDDDPDDYDDYDDSLAAGVPPPAPGELALDVDARSTVRVEEQSGDVRLIFTAVGDADPRALQLDLQQDSARLTAACAE